MNYIKLIQNIINNSNINCNNNIKDEDINSNTNTNINNDKENISINNDNIVNIFKNYENIIKDDKFIQKVNYKLIILCSDIKKDQYEGIIGFCLKKNLDNKNNKNYKITESIWEYLEKTFIGKWF